MRERSPYNKNSRGGRFEKQSSGKEKENRRYTKSSTGSGSSDDRKENKQYKKVGKPGFRKKWGDSDFKRSGKKDYEPTKKSADGKIRLNKFIANSGVCSRREADMLITAGVVTVNGKIVNELGTKINPGDLVVYDGKKLTAEKKMYVLLNKPKDYITTADDPQGRKTVMELVKNAGKQRLYPVGRLDRNTTGLLIMTNDGDMAKKLTHPKHGVRKIYHVHLDKPVTKADMQKIASGVVLDNEKIIPDDIDYAVKSDDKTQVGIELHSGQNRVVRRIFESLDYKVLKLDRVVFAGLTKKDLPRGKWRYLSEKEVSFLKMNS
ncbi:MAG: pseudouridine synthase [Bacteroidales bacterium]